MKQSWNEYFMEIAEKLSTRSTCDRAHVGAVITNEDKRIVSTGYNGSLPGGSHCDDHGHVMRDGHCIATIHAEINAIVYCAKEGVSLKDTSIYVTHFPCLNCTKQIIASGIKKVYYKNDYRPDSYARQLLDENKIALERVFNDE